MDYSFDELENKLQKIYFRMCYKWLLEQRKELERQVDKDEMEEF